MKRIVYFVTGLAAVAVMFWLFSSTCTFAQVDTNDAIAAQYQLDYQRAVDEQKEREKRYADLLRTQEEMTKRSEILLTAQEQFMKKQAVAFERFEKVLDTWERQQKQYQKYLDSLTK